MKYTGDPQHLEELANLGAIDLPSFLSAADHFQLTDATLAEMQDGTFRSPEPHYSSDFLHAESDKLARLQHLSASVIEHIQLPRESDPHYPVDHVLYRIIIQRCSELEQTFMLLKTIQTGNDKGSFSHIISIYGQPSGELYALASRQQETFRRANLDHRQRKQKDQTVYEDRQIIGAFRRVLSAYGFTDWSVTTSSATSVETNLQSRTISVPLGLKVSESELQRLIGRHIETFARGHANTLALLGYLLPSDTPLGVLVPWLARSMDTTAYFGAAAASDVHIAANILGTGHNALPSPWPLLATQYYLGRSFCGTLKWLCQELQNAGYYTDDAYRLAWRYACAIARGHTDFSHHGYAFTQDVSGFQGYYALQVMPPEQRHFTQNFNTLSPRESEILFDAASQSDCLDYASSILLTPAYPSRRLALSDQPLAD